MKMRTLSLAVLIMWVPAACAVADAPEQICGRSDWADDGSALSRSSALITRDAGGHAAVWICSDLMVCHEATRLLRHGQVALGWQDDGKLVIVTDGDVEHQAPPSQLRKPWPEIVRRDLGIANVGPSMLREELRGLNNVVDLSTSSCSALPDFRTRP